MASSEATTVEALPADIDVATRYALVCHCFAAGVYTRVLTMKVRRMARKCAMLLILAHFHEQLVQGRFGKLEYLLSF